MHVEAVQAELTAKAEEVGAVGAAVGVLVDGIEMYGFHGRTSIENSLSVDADTLFQIGSTTKTFTATAVMRLVERGQLDLDSPVRRYLPHLRLRDEDTAARVTVRHLLNHTAGWEGDNVPDTGPGDDALDRLVPLLAQLRQVSALGTTVSYNNSAFSLAGHLLAQQAGTTYERAISQFVLEPLGMRGTFFAADDVMTRRFAVGHQHQAGEHKIQRPWALPRSVAPAGGAVATVGDQISWARLHLGDGTTASGEPFLGRKSLEAMQSPTVDCPGNVLGDAVGIGWLLSAVEGVRVVKHGGATLGQYSSFVMVPARRFAVVVLTNSIHGGPQLNQHLVEWALTSFLGLRPSAPEGVLLPASELDAYAGRFEMTGGYVDLTPDEGRLRLQLAFNDEVRAQLEAAGQSPDQPVRYVTIQAGAPDRYVGEGSAAGLVGTFERDDNGLICGINVGGRLATRLVNMASPR